MKENILIKSERYDISRHCLSLAKAIGVLIGIGTIIGLFIWKAEYGELEFMAFVACFTISAIFLAPAIIPSLLIYYWLRSSELTVTDKRIYGTAAWGRRVDLPVDLMSSTELRSFWKGITVSTSSGKISFLALKNVNEIYSVLNELMITRQAPKNRPEPAPSASNPATDPIEKLRRFKELLDEGIISQEEYESKKKQLLDM